MSIILSEEHGVNPSILQCPICGKENGIALLGRIKGDKKAPMKMAGDPCDQCVEYMKKGIVIVSCKDNNSNYRTGNLVVVKDTTPFLCREVLGDIYDAVMKMRFLILDESVWKKFGLPIDESKEEVSNEDEI